MALVTFNVVYLTTQLLGSYLVSVVSGPSVTVQFLCGCFFISLIRMRSKRDIKMGRLCTPGGAVLGIVGGGCDVLFFKW